jgi:hypothetical protein
MDLHGPYAAGEVLGLARPHLVRIEAGASLWDQADGTVGRIQGSGCLAKKAQMSLLASAGHRWLIAVTS